MVWFSPEAMRLIFFETENEARLKNVVGSSEKVGYLVHTEHDSAHTAVELHQSESSNVEPKAIFNLCEFQAQMHAVATLGQRTPARRDEV
jgi:hypothetical protein